MELKMNATLQNIKPQMITGLVVLGTLYLRDGVDWLATKARDGFKNAKAEDGVKNAKAEAKSETKS